MVIAGIIAEYNPFHNGHAYQISKLREITGAAHCIIAMSGDFLQRGVPALLDKYSRTRMALSCGSDMVVELPAIYATAQAEWFARGGVTLLSACGITHLGFGAECSSLENLQALARLFTEEPEAYRSLLQSYCRAGLSYPQARSKAVCDYLANTPSASSLLPKDAEAILQQPNNILAIEYLKAIRRYAPHIIPVLIPRIGTGYHDIHIEGSIASATAIRKALPDTASVSAALPPAVLTQLDQAVSLHRLLTEDALSGALSYLLSFYQADGSDDVIIRRALRQKDEFSSYSSFCQRLHTKELTLTAIQRRLLHWILTIPEQRYFASDAEVFSGITPYIRVLGFRRSHAELMSLIGSSSCPAITRPADGEKLLEETLTGDMLQEALFSYRTDLLAASFYNSLVRQMGGVSVRSDYAEPMVILE